MSSAPVPRPFPARPGFPHPTPGAGPGPAGPARSGDGSAGAGASAGSGTSAGSDGSGHPAVDAVIQAIANAAGLPPADQIAQYEAAHRTLRETLATIDQA